MTETRRRRLKQKRADDRAHVRHVLKALLDEGERKHEYTYEDAEMSMLEQAMITWVDAKSGAVLAKK